MFMLSTFPDVIEALGGGGVGGVGCHHTGSGTDETVGE